MEQGELIAAVTHEIQLRGLVFLWFAFCVWLLLYFLTKAQIGVIKEKEDKGDQFSGFVFFTILLLIFGSLAFVLSVESISRLFNTAYHVNELLK